MFCSNCGHKIENEVKFCPECGAAMAAKSQREPEEQNEESSEQAESKTDHVIEAVKALCSSPVVLTAIIAYSVMAFFNLYDLVAILEQQTGLFSGGSQGKFITVVVDLLSLLTSIVNLAAPVVLAVGLWITYISACNRQSVRVNVAGLSMIRVVLLINLVSWCTEIGTLVISIIDSYGTSMLFVVLILAGVLALGYLFYSKAIVIVDIIKTALSTGDIIGSVPTYVGVIAYILGGLSALAMLLVMFVPDNSLLSYVYSSINALTVLVIICTVTANIAFGIFVYSCRNRMDYIRVYGTK